MVFHQPDEHRSSTTSASKARKRKTDVTEARSRAQRTKLETQVKAGQHQRASEAAREETSQTVLQARRRAAMTLARAIDDYLQDHEGGNHSKKTLEWHHTALGLLQRFLKEERDITLVGEVEATDISAWFAYMRKVAGKHGKPRSERTIQTYARSVRAFFHWLVRREIIERNPFDRIVFPKVGRPLIQTIEPEEFEQLLLDPDTCNIEVRKTYVGGHFPGKRGESGTYPKVRGSFHLLSRHAECPLQGALALSVGFARKNMVTPFGTVESA